MNKTTLEGLEEALERLEQIDGMYSWGHLLFEVREALADYPMDYEQGFVDGVEAQLVEPVLKECRHCGFLCKPNPDESKPWYPLTDPVQEPVAWAYFDADGSFMDALNRQHGAYQTPLYAAPVEAQAIRAEALEEAAKAFEQYPNNKWTGKGCAAAIRGLK